MSTPIEATVKVPAKFPLKKHLESLFHFLNTPVKFQDDSVPQPTLDDAVGFVAIANKIAQIPEPAQKYASIAEQIFAGTVNNEEIMNQILSELNSRPFLLDALSIADVLIYLSLHPFALKSSTPNIPYNTWSNSIKEATHDKLPPCRVTAPVQKEKKAPAASTPDVDPLSQVEIRVGKIVKVWVHPSADSLYREEIDIGGGHIKQVVTGVRKFYTIEQMQDRHVLVFCNIKPSKIRGEPSEAMVYAASDETDEHVELLDPPADAQIGERIICGDFIKGEPVACDSKGKLGKAVAPHFTINENGQACYKGVPIMLPQGPVTVPSLRSCSFH